MEPKKGEINVKRLAIIIGIVIAITLSVGGSVWYVMKNQAITDQKELNQQIEEAKNKAAETQELKKSVDKKDETADWKTYNDHLGRFSIKYPQNWSFQEDVAQGADGSLNSNVFADDNVMFFDATKKMVIGINMGEVYGRGGACTKRMVSYEPNVTAKKLTIVKKDDKNTAVSTDEYCGVGEALTGYQTTIATFTETGVSYFIHSENPSATDAVSAEAVTIFERMAGTMTFK